MASKIPVMPAKYVPMLVPVPKVVEMTQVEVEAVEAAIEMLENKLMIVTEYVEEME